MILNGCFLAKSGVPGSLLAARERNPGSSSRSYNSTIAAIPRPHNPSFPIIKRRSEPLVINPLRFSPSSPLLLPAVPELPRRRRLQPQPPRASMDVPQSYRFPPMEEKPRWWWRTLACIPYLLPLHETCICAETAYHLHPFLEDFEFLTYPFLGSLGKLPGWFFMAYFFVAYLGVVKRKEWPHFFRFHVVMGMLLEIALQVVGTVSTWMPLAWYWGKAGMHFWTAFAFGYLFTVLECIRCSLAGMYADVPFVCDAAYIQIPYE